MNLVDRIEKFLFESSRPTFVATTLFISICKTGIWYIPNIGLSRTIAVDPFRNPIVDPYAHYLYWNWLANFVAWSIGADRASTYFLFHLVLAVAFTSIFLVATFRRLPDREARIAFLVFSVLPVSGTVYYWVGMDAAVLVLMSLPLLFSRSLVAPLVCGIALGMQHFEQGMVAGGILLATTVIAIRMRLVTPYPARFSLAWIAGVATGKVLLTWLFRHWGVTVNDGRMTLFNHEFRTLMLEAAFHVQFIVWSMLGVGWIVLLGYVGRVRREAIPLVAGLLLSMPFLVLAQDETRVISIITFPVLTAWWLSNRRALALVSGREAAWIWLLWVLVPWSWAWLGIPRWSALPYDLFWIIDKTIVPLPHDWLDSVKLFG